MTNATQRRLLAAILATALAPLTLVLAAPAQAVPAVSAVGYFNAGLSCNYLFPSEITDAPFYARVDCGYANLTLSEAGTAVEARLFDDAATTSFATVPATGSGTSWQVAIDPEDTWPTGKIRLEVWADGAKAGTSHFGNNLIGATATAGAAHYLNGQPITVTGTTTQLHNAPFASNADIPATFTLQAVNGRSGEVLHTQTVTSDEDGGYTATVPGSATANVVGDFLYDYLTPIQLKVADAAWTDVAVIGSTGPWSARNAVTGVTKLQSPPNSFPVAIVDGPAQAFVDQPVRFHASGSYDSETPSSALTFKWNFGDGGSTVDATGEEAVAHFGALGTYTVTLTVTDTGGEGADPLSDTDSMQVQVVKEPPGSPTAIARALPANAWVGQEITFDSSRSTDPDGDALTYEWDFGDGPDAYTSKTQFKKRYRTPGIYTVRLKVTDSKNLVAYDSIKVYVAARVHCESDAVTRGGGWRKVVDSRAQAGAYCDNLGKRAGADVLAFTVTGTRFAVSFGRSYQGGVARVLVDGTAIGKISFESRSRIPRFYYEKLFTGLQAGQHRIRLVTVRGQGYVDFFRVYGPLG